MLDCLTHHVAAEADFHNTGQLWSCEEYTLVQQGHTSMVQMFAPLSSYDGGGQSFSQVYNKGLLVSAGRYVKLKPDIS